MGRRTSRTIDIEFGDITLTLSPTEVRFLKCAAQGEARSYFGGGPQHRLTTYLREKTGIAGTSVALYCRVAFGAGLVGLIPADCVKGAEWWMERRSNGQS